MNQVPMTKEGPEPFRRNNAKVQCSPEPSFVMLASRDGKNYVKGMQAERRHCKEIGREETRRESLLT